MTASMRATERFAAARYLSLSADQWDSLPRDEQLALLAGLAEGNGGEVAVAS